MSHFIIKAQPEDFLVEERIAATFLDTGPFAFYRLIKRNWGTLELLGSLAKDLRIPFERVSYGGRKDKRAHTTQYISIEHPRPLADIQKKDYSLTFCGFLDRPMGPDLIAANVFTIVVRDLDRIVAENIVARAGSLEFANYFDDQRFGSFDPRMGFVAEKIIKKQYNGALKAYLTSAFAQDPASARQRKKLFFDSWRSWETCLGAAKTPVEKEMFGFLLKHPTGFLPLLQRIPRHQMSLFFAAYQSHIWNEVLRRTVRARFPGQSRLRVYEGASGEYLFPSDDHAVSMPPLVIPLPAAKMTVPDEVRGIYAAVFVENGIRPAMFNTRAIRQAYCKAHARAAFVRPEALTAQAEADELYRGKYKVVFNFSLGAGSYATMFLKCLFSEYR